MLTSIQIENFRCFEQLSVQGLSRVNLIAGKNNVGKTTFLEGITLLAAGNNPTAIVHLSGLRSPTKTANKSVIQEFLLSSLFKDFDDSQTIKIQGHDNQQQQYSLEINSSSPENQVIDLSDDSSDALWNTAQHQQGITISYTGPDNQDNHQSITEISVNGKGRAVTNVKHMASPSFTVFLIPSRLPMGNKQRTEMFGSWQLAQHEDPFDLVQDLRVIEPRLSGVQTVVLGGEPMLYGDIGMGRLVPLSVMGEGINRLVTILLVIATNPDSILLIDEIENGLHHSVVSEVWKLIDRASARFNVQVIATTHSYECIQAASDTFLNNGGSSAFRLHRLDRVKEKFKSVTYDDEALEGAMEGYLEVR